MTFRELQAKAGTDFYYRLRSTAGRRGFTAGEGQPQRRQGPGQRAGRPRGRDLSYTGRAANASSYQIQISTHYGSRTARSPWRATAHGRQDHRPQRRHGLLRPRPRRERPVKGPGVPRRGSSSPPRPRTSRWRPTTCAATTSAAAADSGAWFLRNVPAVVDAKAARRLLARAAKVPDIVVDAGGEHQGGVPHRAERVLARRVQVRPLDLLQALAVHRARRRRLTLDDRKKRFATWNLLRDRSTGTAFYIVNAHLEPYKGAELDRLRKQPDRTADPPDPGAVNGHRLPVVWAGDWNSNKSNANQENYPGGYDAPRSASTRR